MKRRILVRGIALGLTNGSLGLAVEQQFKFRLPEGFKPPHEVTLVEGVLGEEVLKEARIADSYGVIMEGGEVAATFSAVENAGEAPLLHSFASVTGMIEKTPALKGAKALSIQTPTISGVTCTRVEIELVTPELAWRRIVYIVPGGKRWAVLQIVAWPERYESLAKQLDTMVRALPGIAETDSSVRTESSQERLAPVGLAMAAGSAIGLAFRALNKRSRGHTKKASAKR